MTDPRAAVWESFRAWMLERTGLTWEQIELTLEAEMEFWECHPAARGVVENE